MAKHVVADTTGNLDLVIVGEVFASVAAERPATLHLDYPEPHDHSPLAASITRFGPYSPGRHATVRGPVQLLSNRSSAWLEPVV